MPIRTYRQDRQTSPSPGMYLRYTRIPEIILPTPDCGPKSKEATPVSIPLFPWSDLVNRLKKKFLNSKTLAIPRLQGFIPKKVSGLG